MRAIPCIGGMRPPIRRGARRMGLAGGLALAAALAAAPEGARAQLDRCSPTVATDAEALRATHVCADTDADGADYGGIAIATSSMEANHLKLVIENGVVVDGSNHSNLVLGYSPADSAVVYHNSGKNVEIVVEPGATIYHSVDQTSESTVGGYALRGYSHGEASSSISRARSPTRRRRMATATGTRSAWWRGAAKAPPATGAAALSSRCGREAAS